MNILIVGGQNPYIVNPRSFRMKELAYELSQRGHTVDLVIGSENRIIYGFNNTHKDDSKTKIDNPIKKRSPLVQKIRTPIANVYHYLFGALSDGKSFLKVKKLLIACSDYDVVIGVALPFYPLMAVAISGFRSDTRIIFDSGDPYYGNRVGIKLAPYWKSIQRLVFAKAD